MHYLKLRLLPTNKNGTCRVLNQGMKNFHTLIWTVRGEWGGGSKKSTGKRGSSILPT